MSLFGAQIQLCRDICEDGSYKIRVPIGSKFERAESHNFRVFLFYAFSTEDHTTVADCFDEFNMESRRIVLTRTIPRAIAQEPIRAYLGAVYIRPKALRMLIKAPSVLHIFELPDNQISAKSEAPEVPSAVR